MFKHILISFMVIQMTSDMPIPQNEEEDEVYLKAIENIYKVAYGDDFEWYTLSKEDFEDDPNY